MADHIDITLLERFLLAEETFPNEERSRIRLHLEGCALCREKMASLERMYQQVEKELKTSPTERDRQAAGRILPRTLMRRTPEERIIEGYGDLVESSKRPIATRFFRSIRLHPYQSAGAVLFVAASLAMLFSLVTPTKNQNPTYAEIKNYVLYVYNKDADVIWKKGAPGMPDWSSTTSPVPGMDLPKRYLLVDDIDGDGVNEVLLVGSVLSSEFTNDTLYCFERTGLLRWKAGAGSMASFGRKGEVHHNRPQIVDFLVMRKSAGLRPQIFVLACEQVYSPTKLFEVSTGDGTISQSYFNRGGCLIVLHKDIDLDGKEELLVAGVNDGFNRACLAILDPMSMGGCSPVPASEPAPEGGMGREMFYILFPRWGIGPSKGLRIYNHVGRLIEPQGGGIDVVVDESFNDPDKPQEIKCSLFFGLGPTLKVDRLMADDTTIRIATSLHKRGIIKTLITNDTFSPLKDSLQFWDGGRFVNSPALNSHYKAELAGNALPGISKP